MIAAFGVRVALAPATSNAVFRILLLVCWDCYLHLYGCVVAAICICGDRRNGVMLVLSCRRIRGIAPVVAVFCTDY